MSVQPSSHSASLEQTHSAETITGSKMPSPDTESTSRSPSSRPGTEAQLGLSENTEEDEANQMTNPFTIPPDIDIFSVRDKERQKAKEERERMKTMKIHEKMTYSAKIKAKPKDVRKALQKEEEEAARKQATDEERLKTLQETLSRKMVLGKDYPLEKQTFCDYINERRETFLLEYAMAVKRDEIQRMENIVKDEERKLEEAEYYLKKDAAVYEEFTKESHANYIQALKIATKETAEKTKKISEFQAITSQIEGLQSDISRFKNTLREYKGYRDFLYQLSPKEWQEEYDQKHAKKKGLKKASKANEESTSPPAAMDPGTGCIDGPSSLLSVKSLQFGPLQEIRPYLTNFLKPLATRKLSSLEDAESETSSDEDEEPKLYFTDFQQLQSSFTGLEEEILSLFQNSQETEKSLDRVQHDFITTYESTEKQSAELKQQVDTLKSSVTKEEERAADLKLKADLFSSGEGEADDQDKMLTSLHKKVLEVYCQCAGENETNLETEEMLMVIEKYFYDLLDNLERIPPAEIAQAKKAKEKERRMRLREEKLRQQKQQQEERLQRALERSQAPTKKPVGRRPMFRSVLPPRKEKKKHSQEQMDTEKEEQLYYFT
ncbi:PREDICTED: coiled-coil domain-containing protein 37 [Pterocles gutturalis]|uniref:coiled-coil domain-containing protein 37 n=1 Tax=Pterocles gutturalis TaxID=240206 RepID=UPI0005286FC5|nr:PREDICTED: coiled-coil domain-containing protein 37 [Pterocles gutturalis]